MRSRVHDLVTSLRDDVPSDSARAATAAALVQTLRTFRGARATTATERQALAQQISDLAKQLKAGPTLVERKALVAEILALTEQRERGAFTADERAQINDAIAALKTAVLSKTDTKVDAFRSLHQQFTCQPT